MEVVARNIGDRPLPYGYAAHPYLEFSGTMADELVVGVPFAEYLGVDDRMLPVSLEPVAGALDLRTPRPLGPLHLDTGFRTPGTDTWEVAVSDGVHTTVVWGDAGLPWVQLFTPGDRRRLAVEPMTCGPDAFNPGPTHHDLVVLAPGQAHRCSWGISTR